MPKLAKWIKSLVVNGLLLLGLASLLIAYIVVVSDLPSRIYTAAQQEYLSRNYARSISQLPLRLNVTPPEGQIAPAILPGRESRVRATLIARYEEQEGVSVTVYDLSFDGKYDLTNPGQVTSTVEVFFPFPSNLQTLHDVRFLINDEEPSQAQYTTQGISCQTELQPGEGKQITISYKADGANSFTYGLHRDQRSDVDVTITVLGLVGSEVPNISLPPTLSEETDGGQSFTWRYTDLIANRDIRLTLPTQLSFAQRVARLQDDFRALATLAPLLVGLFLAALVGLLHMAGVRLPMAGYLLLGLALALFYPMLTFLSGLVHVVVAATLALLLVSGLCVLFLGLTIGWGRTWWRVGLLLIIFLGFFSLGMLTPWRGLLLTCGGLLLLSTYMLLYARRPTMPEPEPSSAPTPTPEPQPTSRDRHCPHCGRALEDDYDFCPACGHDTRSLLRCVACGHEQFVPAELRDAHCIRCGRPLERGTR
ncbi:MAG: zinc ribbon domain-containing protein [Anaerolineae bacterium]|jgi:hypothetical protein